MSNLIVIVSLVSEIWLATERQTDRHGLSSTVKFAKSLMTLQTKSSLELSSPYHKWNKLIMRFDYSEF